MLIFLVILLTGTPSEGLNNIEPEAQCAWTSWSNYTSCSVSCGEGNRVRSRTCISQNSTNVNISINKTCSINSTTDCANTHMICNDTSCSKNITLTEPCPDSDNMWCNEGPCPSINGSWSEWSNFTDCSQSCGGGLQTRTRACDAPAPEYGGLDCDGDSVDVRQCHTVDCPGWSNKGKEFIFGFMPNDALSTFLILFVTTEDTEGASVTITLPLFSSFLKTFNVRKGQLRKVTIDSKIIGGKGIENKGILVESDKDIVVYAVNRQTSSSDAFMVLPTTALSQEYYVLAWNIRSAFMIIATEDNTEINIKFGQHVETVNILNYNKRSGDSITINMNRFQTIFITSSGDLTGTHIYGSTPVALLGGSICTRIGKGGCDHLVEQLIPIEKWGKDFVTISMPDCKSDDTYKIVTSQPNTVVTVAGKSSYTISRPGEFVTFNSKDSESTTISSVKPISVALFSNGGCGSVYNGDPSMILLPAIQQYSSDYTFSTVALEGKEFENSLALVILDFYVDGLRLDDRTLPSTTWKRVVGRPDIKYTELKVSVGVHTIRHIDPNVTFLAVSTGIQSYNSYGYPGGISFKDSMSSCTTGSSKTAKGDNNQGCSIGLDPCKDVPCLNNGTCKPRGWTNYECLCPKTFGGPICEIDLCQLYPTDVVFLMDSSESMEVGYFYLQKQFLLNITADWQIDEDHFQIAVVTFSSLPKLIYDFQDIHNRTDFHEKFEHLSNTGGASDLYNGLKFSENFLNSRSRRVNLTNVRKYLIVLTDGLTYPVRNLALGNRDIEVRVVAVGEDVSHYFLQSINGPENVFPLDSTMFKKRIRYELIHSICSGCKQTQNTDVLIAVDVSSDIDGSDLRSVVPSVMSKLLSKINTKELPDIRLSLVTFNDNVQVRFLNMTYTNETKFQLEGLSSIFPEPQGKVNNFSNILSSLADFSFNESSGARVTAKKVILIISQFKFDVNGKEIKTYLLNDVNIFTVGLNFEEDAFEKMTFLAGSPFFVGSVGSTMADQVDDFLDVVVRQLSYVKCKT